MLSGACIPYAALRLVKVANETQVRSYGRSLKSSSHAPPTSLRRTPIRVCILVEIRRGFLALLVRMRRLRSHRCYYKVELRALTWPAREEGEVEA